MNLSDIDNKMAKKLERKVMKFLRNIIMKLKSTIF